MLSLGIFFSCAHIILYNIVWARWIGSLRCCYDIILEIGPGTGNLTKKLLEAGKSVVAVELDPRMVPELQRHFQGMPLSNRLKKMSMGDFLSIQPSELKFSIDLMKRSLCSMQLANKTDWYIAFKKLFNEITNNCYKIATNKNVSTMMIVKLGPVVELVNHKVDSPHYIDWNKAKRTLKNLMIKATNSNMEHKIYGLNDRMCRDQTFSLNHRGGEDQDLEITVYEYFVHKRNTR